MVPGQIFGQLYQRLLELISCMYTFLLPPPPTECGQHCECAKSEFCVTWVRGAGPPPIGWGLNAQWILRSLSSPSSFVKSRPWVGAHSGPQKSIFPNKDSFLSIGSQHPSLALLKGTRGRKYSCPLGGRAWREGPMGREGAPGFVNTWMLV